jgi:hypothetical protein
MAALYALFVILWIALAAAFKIGNYEIRYNDYPAIHLTVPSLR